MTPRSDATTTAIVTGASSGIGTRVAERLHRRDYHVLLIARRADRLNALADRLGRDRATPLPLDLLDHGTLATGLVAALDGLPPVSVLVNNAGFGQHQPVLELDDAAHRAQFELHVFTPLWLIRRCLPGMLERGAGHVINVASIAAKCGPWGHGSYAASKAALLSLTQTLAAEHEGTGVRFSCVLPGLVRTEFFDDPAQAGLRDQLARRGIPADRVARVIERLLDRPRLEACVPGHYRVLDWIRAISPRLMHHLVSRSSQPR